MGDLHRHNAVVDGALLRVGLHLGSVTDWTLCGTTTGPDQQCMAVTEKSTFLERCPKQASIQILLERSVRHLTQDGFVRVCGGHFTVHRSGKELRVAL